jgi:predicted ATPase
MSVLTFLFTDIEGSTRRWEADADAMQVALEAHNKVLRDTVEANAGTVFNYTGDGMCAVFASPRSAVDAAIDAQRALELPVRMGIATGEAERRGDDYFGTVLNRTARLMSAGHGGQILIDGATAALSGDLDVIQLGSKRLRDIAKPVEVFQVRADGLRSEFPPLKTLDVVPGNLRPPTTSFVGRSSELAELTAALKIHRMVTLTGVGGVGKTRLALEVASRSAHDFPDGVWVIELASISDPAAVPEAVSAALGILQQPGKSLAHSVATALEGRSRLLVFDNCEHVLDAAADMVEAIFAHSQTVKVLATSREGLRAADEHLWSVPSLDVDDGIDSSAAALFIERAAAVGHSVPTAGGNDVGAVIEICRQLDGIPLGIELAASRMQSMTATEVRDRLGDRFRLLVGSRRGLERHQTLRHAVQWSYDLLDDAEKSLLNRCSLFAGGFDLAGAQSIAELGDDFATLDLLDALVRKSLLTADRTSARTRFWMLETIRQFAEDQLVVSGEGAAARTAHARYFADREHDVMALWDSARQREAYEWFTLELANLRTAFRWAADTEDLDTAATIATMSAFLGLRVQQHEPITWVEELIEPARAVDFPRLPQLYSMAAQCYTFGRIDDALRYAEAGLAAIDTGRFAEVPYESEAWLGGIYISLNKPQRWEELCRNMIARGTGDQRYARGALVLAMTMVGKGAEAAVASTDLLTMADATDNAHTASYLLLCYGIAQHSADFDAAHDAHRRGLEIAHDTDNRELESYHAGNLARLVVTHGDAAEALGYVELALHMFHDANNISQASSGLAVLAALLDRLGYYEPAATISTSGWTGFTQTSFPEFESTITHLREALGDRTYESLGRVGTSMTNAAMAEFAFEQIAMARASLQPP